MSEADNTPTVSPEDTPDTLYTVFADDEHVPEVTTRDETAARELADDRGWVVVTYQKD